MMDHWLLALSEDDFPELSYEDQRNLLGKLSIANLEEFMSVVKWINLSISGKLDDLYEEYDEEDPKIEEMR